MAMLGVARNRSRRASVCLLNADWFGQRTRRIIGLRGKNESDAVAGLVVAQTFAFLPRRRDQTLAVYENGAVVKRKMATPVLPYRLAGFYAGELFGKQHATLNPESRIPIPDS
ncbi:MAG: hypothetical protein HYR56_12600 [Acidobacteria bacterium]|nr:hypothetical protein [Acidobacteriota bacterium]MBI3425139.1 hypothetical protein [Acidobacteriota bacterium]